MQRNSTQYVLFFTMAMTVVVAVVLAGMYSSLKGIHTANERNYNKKQILSSLNQTADFANKKADKLSDDEAAQIFADRVASTIIDAYGQPVEGNAEDVNMEKEEKKPETDRVYPVFKYNATDGKSYYILSVRGNGLWDKIWGWVAVENNDVRTVAGAAFGHKGETPGLGAEIADNSGWKAKFTGTQLYTPDGKYKSVEVKKGGAQNKMYQVDGIAGATVTANGVSEMLDRGLAVYMPYMDEERK